MDYLIFRTDLTSKKRVNAIKPVLQSLPIAEWSVDTQDVDHVLRIKAAGKLGEKDIVKHVRSHGFYCEVLPD